MKKTFTYLALAVMLIYLAYTYLPIFSKVRSGDPAPIFTTELIDGSTFNLAEQKGNYVLLDFWGSWCAPCLREAPQLVKLNKKYENQTFKNGANFMLVSIALEKDGKRWEKTAEKYRFDWKHQIVQQSKLVMMAPLAQKYGVTDIPAKFLVLPDGTMQSVNSFTELDQFLSEQI